MISEENRLRSTAHFLFWIAALLAVGVPLALLISKGLGTIKSLPLGEWGDFLAGAFGPASLLVLAAGFFLQQEELRLQRRELEATRATLESQREELSKSASEQNKTARLIALQTILELWEVRRENIREILALSSSQVLQLARSPGGLMPTQLAQMPRRASEIDGISDDAIDHICQIISGKISDEWLSQDAAISYMKSVDDCVEVLDRIFCSYDEFMRKNYVDFDYTAIEDYERILWTSIKNFLPRLKFKLSDGSA